MFYLWPTEGFWVSFTGSQRVLPVTLQVLRYLGEDMWSRPVVDCLKCSLQRLLVPNCEAVNIARSLKMDMSVPESEPWWIILDLRLKSRTHPCIIYMYTTCAYDLFHVYLQHPAMQLEACNSFEWKKTRFFFFKRRSGRSCSWTHGILAAILVTLGHLGSPWVTLGHHHQRPGIFHGFHIQHPPS